MKTKRIISALLAVLMLLGSFSMVVAAEEADTESTENEATDNEGADTQGIKKPAEYTYATENSNSLMAENPDFESESPTAPNKDQYLYQTGTYIEDGTKKVVSSPAEKLALMDYRYGNDDYGLYVDGYSGEVALVRWATGETLFTNPYNIGQSSVKPSSTSTIHEELLSQLIISFKELATSSDKVYMSYVEAAQRKQITVKNIKGGIRLEYSIGREATKTLAPEQISVETMEKKIMGIIKEKLPDWNKDGTNDFALFKKFRAMYDLKDPDAINVSNKEKEEMHKLYPITKEKPIYIFKSDIKAAQIAWIEQIIKTYCPDYSFADLDADHAEVGFEQEVAVFPLFKMALEYTIDENGLSVRLPANGIRFDETRYQLNYIEVLPFMGAATDPNEGYSFFPDGSGTLFDFQSIESSGVTQAVSGKVYGQDYAYHEVSGKYEEVVRYPVFGLVETATEKVDGVDTEVSRGFVAIVEEGDSLMELTSYHAGASSEYHTVRMKIYPRPIDSYNLQDAISVGDNATVTVVSSRKYTGSYQMRYMLLSDFENEEKLGEDYYECSYVGMAKAYREYLEQIGTLTRLTDKDVESDIPLYIETFGSVLATKKFLSIPFEVTVPLTSFKDVTRIYEDLEKQKITNVNFVLTGYTDGGLKAEKMPYNLKWDKAVEDEMTFEDLLAYAKKKNVGIFPDFNFVFSNTNTLFDGLSLNKHAVKTIDNRYTTKREYSATKHTYVSYFELAISPSYFSHFYEKFMSKYLEAKPTGISLSTLGSYLNSDFDEDEPYNRSDSQNYTEEAFAYFDTKMDKGEVMTSGGNAYSWKYVDHLKDVATDSSRYILSSASVPFLGMVLHGYVEFAGEPINMEGNVSYAFLKSLESGAALNFLLSYSEENTSALKENESTSQYYSVRYKIWREDVIEMYKELNDLLKGVQTSTIDIHEFMSVDPTASDYVVRIPDADELKADSKSMIEQAVAAAAAKKAAEAEKTRLTVLAKKTRIVDLSETLKTGLKSIEDKKASFDGLTKKLEKAIADLKTAIAAEAVPEVVEEGAQTPPATPETPKDSEAVTLAKEAVVAAYEAICATVASTEDEIRTLEQEIKYAQKLLAELDALENFDRGIYNNLKTIVDEQAKTLDTLKKMENSALAKATEAAAMAAEFEGLLKAYKYEANVPSTDDLESALLAEIDKVMENSVYAEDLAFEEPQNTQISSQYRADKNTVVYQQYSNGTEFMLNFNDYDVLVHYQGTTYTINAYGYIVLNRAN